MWWRCLTSMAWTSSTLNLSCLNSFFLIPPCLKVGSSQLVKDTKHILWMCLTICYYVSSLNDCSSTAHSTPFWWSALRNWSSSASVTTSQPVWTLTSLKVESRAVDVASSVDLLAPNANTVVVVQTVHPWLQSPSQSELCSLNSVVKFLAKTTNKKTSYHEEIISLAGWCTENNQLLNSWLLILGKKRQRHTPLSTSVEL